MTEIHHSTNLVQFQFESHDIRVLTFDDGHTEWPVKDVCTALGLTNVTEAARRLKKHEKVFRRIESLGGAQETLTVTESGLYRLIFRSDKPSATAFQDLVFETILPQIRKTGKYEVASARVHQVKNPIHQLLIDTVIRLDALEQQAQEADAKAEAANANAIRALESQLFFTVAEYVYCNKLQSQLPHSGYRACSDHLRIYCFDNRIPFRKIPVGGQRWEEEYAFHVQVYTEVLPGWLTRRASQATLHALPTTKETP